MSSAEEYVRHWRHVGTFRQSTGIGLTARVPIHLIAAYPPHSICMPVWRYLTGDKERCMKVGLDMHRREDGTGG